MDGQFDADSRMSGCVKDHVTLLFSTVANKFLQKSDGMDPQHTPGWYRDNLVPNPKPFYCCMAASTPLTSTMQRIPG